MPSPTTYAEAQANLAALCDEATSTREPIIIQRPGSEDVALVAASELSGLIETAYLLRSPKNARRLRAVYARVQERLRSLKAPETSETGPGVEQAS